jgi:hypothetical protein
MSFSHSSLRAGKGATAWASVWSGTRPDPALAVETGVAAYQQAACANSFAAVRCQDGCKTHSTPDTEGQRR